MDSIIHVENLFVNYGSTQALEDVSLDIPKGEFLGLIGPNGGGKSTLLKAILGFVPISSGKILINAKSIGYVPQHSSIDKKFPINVFEVVLSGRLKKGISPFFQYTKKDKEIAYEQLESIGIGKLANRQISELSGGEFQKMLIARALASKPEILLLDEPTASVDAYSKIQIYDLLEELNKEMTIVLVSHDNLTISSKVHRMACLNKKLTYHCKSEEVNLDRSIV